jgi:hypothetical protein
VAGELTMDDPSPPLRQTQQSSISQSSIVNRQFPLGPPAPRVPLFGHGLAAP